MSYPEPDRPALDEIEVTPAMIAEGAGILLSYCRAADSEAETAERMFRAMAALLPPRNNTAAPKSWIVG